MRGSTTASTGDSVCCVVEGIRGGPRHVRTSRHSKRRCRGTARPGHLQGRSYRLLGGAEAGTAVGRGAPPVARLGLIKKREEQVAAVERRSNPRPVKDTGPGLPPVRPASCRTRLAQGSRPRRPAPSGGGSRPRHRLRLKRLPVLLFESAWKLPWPRRAGVWARSARADSRDREGPVPAGVGHAPWHNMTTTTSDASRQPQLTALVQLVESDVDPLTRLEALRDLVKALDSLRPTLVAAARDQGSSDAEVGRRLGISRQAVAKRHPRTRTDSEGEGSATPARQRDQRPVPDDGRSPLSRPSFEVTTAGGRVLLRVNRVGRPGR